MSGKTVRSPCIGVCDVFDGMCMGCFRDIHEISDWHDMSDAQRRDLLLETERRRQQFNSAEQA